MAVLRDCLTAAGTLADGLQLIETLLMVDVDILEIALVLPHLQSTPFGQQSKRAVQITKDYCPVSDTVGVRTRRRILILDWSSLELDRSSHKPHYVVTSRKQCARDAKADTTGFALLRVLKSVI